MGGGRDFFSLFLEKNFKVDVCWQNVVNGTSPFILSSISVGHTDLRHAAKFTGNCDVLSTSRIQETVIQ